MSIGEANLVMCLDNLTRTAYGFVQDEFTKGNVKQAGSFQDKVLFLVGESHLSPSILCHHRVTPLCTYKCTASEVTVKPTWECTSELELHRLPRRTSEVREQVSPRIEGAPDEDQELQM